MQNKTAVSLCVVLAALCAPADYVKLGSARFSSLNDVGSAASALGILAEQPMIGMMAMGGLQQVVTQTFGMADQSKPMGAVVYYKTALPDFKGMEAEAFAVSMAGMATNLAFAIYVPVSGPEEDYLKSRGATNAVDGAYTADDTLFAVVQGGYAVWGDSPATVKLAAGEMAGALAHELNQPLTAMGAYASAYDALQARGEAGARLDAAINGMRAEAQRAGDVVRRLRDFFRTGATKLETVVLGEIIVAAAERYKARALQSGVTFLVMEVPEIMLLADRLQLEVVLRNLLSNAFDAVVVADVGGGQVSIQAVRLPGEQVMICVEDSGAGLTSQDAERAFESFHSSKSSGLGLGLVISRAIAETHGGSLWGDVADHGVFKLVLPTLESSKTPLHDR